MAMVPDDAPQPRLCHVIKWPDFNGYGFNLHAEKGKAGQYIGKVDEDSPAEFAALKQNDRIVEVNGVNIGNENHQQVVTRIKAGGNETKLLVVDATTDGYYKEKKIVVRGDMPNVSFSATPVPRPSATVNGTAQQVEAEVNHSPTVQAEEVIQQIEPEPQPEIQAEVAAAETDEVGASDEEIPTTDIFEPEVEDEVADDVTMVTVSSEALPPPPQEFTTTEPEPPTAEPPSTEPETEVQTTAQTSEPDQEVVQQTTESAVETAQSELVSETSEPELEAAAVPESVPESTVVTQEEVVVAAAAATVVASEPEPTPAPELTPVVEPVAVAPTLVATQNSGAGDGLNFSMSLQEAREQVSRRSKKKHEVKNDPMNIKDKFELFQRL